MKASRTLFLAALVLLPVAALAQSYSIDWYTVDGGGGTSTGSVYTVSGTIGQPDAGTMSGGNYSLQGGFWGIVAAIQTPGAPILTITKTATNTVVVSWPSPSTGYNIQQSATVASPGWGAVPQTVDDNGTVKSIVVNPPAGNLYYRLIK